MADCGSRKQRVSRGISTDGTVNAVFVPFVRLDSNDIKEVKVSYDLATPTGAQLQVRRARRGSQDGFSWDSPVEFGAAFSGTTGWSYGTAYQATDVANQINEFGLVVKNAQAGGLELAWVAFEIEMRKP